MPTNGAAGFDGWCQEEVRALIAFAPWIVEGIYVLLIRTMREAPSRLPDAVRDIAFLWRVAGIPQRDPGESRLISIASSSSVYCTKPSWIHFRMRPIGNGEKFAWYLRLVLFWHAAMGHHLQGPSRTLLKHMTASCTDRQLSVSTAPREKS